MTHPDSWRMTPREKRSSFSLAGIFALRMLGLFVILPVFALFARDLPGGDDKLLVGLALGIYGLTQGVLQIPFGAASDRWGRRPVIALGLLIFALGSFIAALADTLPLIILGRALQGAGAISAAVTAFISDAVRECVITKAMAIVGASIGLTFALSLVIAPPLARLCGVPGIFALTGVLALIALLVLKTIPDAPKHALTEEPSRTWQQILFDSTLLRLDLGVFLLHAVLTALFVVMPLRIANLGIAPTAHWQIYLPAVLVGFTAMAPLIIRSERKGHIVQTLRLMVLCLGVVFVLLALCGNFAPSLWSTGILLALFFMAFNVLEATLPSLLARLAPRRDKGLALGIYNTAQNLGLFTGGVLGGLIARTFSAETLLLTCAFAMLPWLVFTTGLREPPARSHPKN